MRTILILSRIKYLDRADSGPGGDGLDLDTGPQRQGGHPEGGPGREGLAGEVAGVDLVDGGEVGDVGEQDRGLDDVVVAEAGLGQDGAHVLEDLLGLGLDVSLDERAGGRVERHLPGDEDERAGPLTGGDALGVGADGGGGVGRGDTADGHGSSFLLDAGVRPRPRRAERRPGWQRSGADARARLPMPLASPAS